MGKVGEVELDGYKWDRYEWTDNKLILQRTCDSPGCDQGLLLAPVRNCPACHGTGFIRRPDPATEIEWEGAKTEAFRVVKKAKCGCQVVYGNPECQVKACKSEHEEIIKQSLESMPIIRGLMDGSINFYVGEDDGF
jgi:hypothetical protein